MKKNALFCVNIYPDKDKMPPETQFAIKTFELYCEKFDLDLIVLDQLKYNLTGNAKYQYLILEKFQSYDFLNGKYDRLLKVDTDMMITSFAPNIFDVVSEDSIGVVYEDVGSRKKRRLHEIKMAQKSFGNIGWENGYFNAGMMVMSQQHNKANFLDKKILSHIKNEQFDYGVREQNIINWKVKDLNYKIQSLDYRWNHMFMFDEINFTNLKLGSLFKDKVKNSFIIHYAGDAIKRAKFMTRDYPIIMDDWNNSVR